MEGDMKESGKKTIWKDLVFTNGKMEESMRVNTKTIRNMGMAYTSGQMAGSTMVTGTKANNMD
jgi:hypothetical protein